MFSLVYGLWKYWFQKDDYFVLILGLDNAGKTTFVEQAKSHYTPEYKGLNLAKISPTVGLNIGKIQTETIVLNFWDLGGQAELQCLWEKVWSWIQFRSFSMASSFICSTIAMHTQSFSLWIHQIPKEFKIQN